MTKNKESDTKGKHKALREAFNKAFDDQDIKTMQDLGKTLLDNDIKLGQQTIERKLAKSARNKQFVCGAALAQILDFVEEDGVNGVFLGLIKVQQEKKNEVAKQFKKQLKQLTIKDTRVYLNEDLIRMLAGTANGEQDLIDLIARSNTKQGVKFDIVVLCARANATTVVMEYLNCIRKSQNNKKEIGRLVREAALNGALDVVDKLAQHDNAIENGVQQLLNSSDVDNNNLKPVLATLVHKYNADHDVIGEKLYQWANSYKDLNYVQNTLMVPPHFAASVIDTGKAEVQLWLKNSLTDAQRNTLVI